MFLHTVKSGFTSRGSLHPVEVTVECNPGTMFEHTSKQLNDAGVNRLSIGVQSLHDHHLKYLGRRHTAATAISAVKGACREIKRVSADLIFGMPGQTTQELIRDINGLVDVGVEHLSIYALTIEKDTLFGALYKKRKLPLATDGQFADLFEAAHARLQQLGFDHYEVSNYGRSGCYAEHNLHYWRGGDYLGIGVGAVGSMNGRRYRNTVLPSKYLKSAVDGGDTEEWSESLGPEERWIERLMLGLRTDEGIPLIELEGLFEARRQSAFTPDNAGKKKPWKFWMDRVEAAAHQGDLEVRDGCLRVPKAKWLFLDAMIARLV